MPKKRRWWDRVDEAIVLGALPLWWQLDKLQKQENVVGVVNCTDEFGGYPKLYKAKNLRQLLIPTLDFASPSVAQLEEALRFIRECVPNGSVYVHCKAGRGRAATVAAAWLIMEYKLSAEDAQRRLKSVRPQVSSSLYKRPTLLEFQRRALGEELQEQLTARRTTPAGADRCTSSMGEERSIDQV